jgi:hypothetical protein
MVTTGTVELLGPFPVIKDGTFQNCNHQTGTYQRWAAAFSFQPEAANGEGCVPA